MSPLKFRWVPAFLSPNIKKRRKYFFLRFFQPCDRTRTLYLHAKRDFEIIVVSASIYETLNMAELSIHRAAEKGAVDSVRRLIEGGVSVDSRDESGRTPLHWAAEQGQYLVVQLLISNKCDLNLKDQDCDTPVFLAACRRNRDLVNLLLQSGAQLNCTNCDNYTLLHMAAKFGYEDIVHRILDSGEADLNAAAECGITPLSLAIGWGGEDVAVILIRAGADIHQKVGADKDTTLLHLTALGGYPKVAQVLLEEKGVDPNPQDKYGETPLHTACVSGRKEKHQEVVKQLLKAGADTTIQNQYGKTALSEGLGNGKITLEEIRLFVHHGAYFRECDYALLSQNLFLKENILKNVDICTQSIINKYHRQSLPALNSVNYFAGKLPTINKFQLNARQVEEVKNLVKWEIERSTFCNVVKTHPMALSALCVLSLI